jgi:hypothetical protein
MKHRHHIIPKHAGGTDDPTNIIELTVEEHAEAHRLLFEQHGKWEDELAWKALSGQISMSDASKEAIVMAGKAWKGMSYEQRHGERAEEIREMRRQSNKNRKGTKYKNTKPRTLENDGNRMRVSCIVCKKETSLQGLGHHKKKCKL